MKLLESYSNSTSTDIKHKPTIYEKFYPLGEITKYITIQNSSGMPAKNYDFYQIVLDLLLPILNKEGIKVIQLGEKEAPQLNGAMDLRGMTTLSQSYFIIKRALLHLGNDSWITHAACAEEVSCVSLYGSTTVVNHAPYHFNPDKSIFLESGRKGYKASFSREEQPKMINFIWPELVVKSVCKLLGLEFKYDFNTLFIGNLFNQKILESGATEVIDVKKLGTNSLVLRLDYNFNLNILRHQLSLNPCQIFTDKEIPIKSLLELKQHVLGVVYRITEQNNPNFVKQLIENKIPYQLISDLPDEILNNIKLNYLDYSVINRLPQNIPPALKDKDLSKIFFKTNKILMANKKFYSSYYEYVNDNPILNPMKVEPHQLNLKNIDLLWPEFEQCMFMEKVIDSQSL